MAVAQAAASTMCAVVSADANVPLMEVVLFDHLVEQDPGCRSRRQSERLGRADASADAAVAIQQSRDFGWRARRLVLVIRPG